MKKLFIVFGVLSCLFISACLTQSSQLYTVIREYPSRDGQRPEKELLIHRKAMMTRTESVVFSVWESNGGLRACFALSNYKSMQSLDSISCIIDDDFMSLRLDWWNSINDVVIEAGFPLPENIIARLKTAQSIKLQVLDEVITIAPEGVTAIRNLLQD